MPTRPNHRVVPAGRAADGCAAALFGFRCIRELQRAAREFCFLLASLLCFKDEAVSLVEIDPARSGRAIAVLECDVAFEDIDVLVQVRFGRIGFGHTKLFTEFAEEQHVVRPLAAPDAAQRSMNSVIDELLGGLVMRLPWWLHLGKSSYGWLDCRFTLARNFI